MSEQNWNVDTTTVAIIGLGYVGLPLAVEFGRYLPTIGFDVSIPRIASLRLGSDATREITSAELASSSHLRLTHDPVDLGSANFFIVTVPTPIDDNKQPDLRPLMSASMTIGKVLKPGDIVVYESTVYPGATEEVCVPILEAESGLSYNKDFFAGYSPERINPGDRTHRLPDIVKVTSGSTQKTAEFIDRMYNVVIRAGTHMAPSIRVAEAAKVIENTQRDLNIALINELAIIFNKLEIDTHAVLAAASTKWNFLNFKPGLVGGHCIGVDPYYLTHKAQQIGYFPQVILAGRRINDGMGDYVVSQLVRLMIEKRIHVADASILVLGLAFKENCADIRNTRVIDIIKAIKSYGAHADVYDPQVDPKEALVEYGLEMLPGLGGKRYDAVILAVAHEEFERLSSEDLLALCNQVHVIYEVKPLFPPGLSDQRL